VEVAIRIEENGINFYKFAEQIAKQEEAKKLFAHLAEAEVAHKKLLKEYSRKWKNTIRRRATWENTAPICALMFDNNIIFTKEAMDKNFLV